MIKKLFINYLKKSALNHGKRVGLWRKIGKPSLVEWTEYLRRMGGFRAIGDNCLINPATVFTDPYLTMIGSNVHITGGTFFGHDGSINMLNNLHGTKLDAVGPIIISDNVFIGADTVVLPGTKIGPNTIIGAGSVISGNVEGGYVYAGRPLKRIRPIEEYRAKLENRTNAYPWKDILDKRSGDYDERYEAQLQIMRVAYFFG